MVTVVSCFEVQSPQLPAFPEAASTLVSMSGERGRGGQGLFWSQLSLTRVLGVSSWLHGTSEGQVAIGAGRTRTVGGRGVLQLQSLDSLLPPPLNSPALRPPGGSDRILWTPTASSFLDPARIRCNKEGQHPPGCGGHSEGREGPILVGGARWDPQRKFKGPSSPQKSILSQ